MKRREFIVLLGGAAIAWPSAAVTQQSDRVPNKLPRIGVLGIAPNQALDDALARGLREHGYIEGQNFLFERRFWQGDRERLAKFAAELASDTVRLILAPTTVDALAAKRATSTIPIVIITPGDPVGVGLAASLARPGGNVTGLSTQGLITTKGLGLLAEAVPEASRFAALMDPGNPHHAQLVDAFEREAAQRRLSILRVFKRSVDDIAPAFAAMAANGAQGVLGPH